jgi:hypothetical protein
MPENITAIVAREDLPSTRSKASERQQSAVELCRDLYAGVERVRECGPQYLPQSPGEKHANYQTRLKRSTFTNFFRRAVDGLVGQVFAVDPKLGKDVPQQIVKHWENIDNAGTHGDVFARELMQDAMVAGHNAILVEYPRTDGKQTLADEMTLRPYWVPIRKEDVISWRETVEDGRTIPSQVVLRECVLVPAGEFGEAVQERYRVLYRERQQSEEGGSSVVVGWRLLEVTKDQKVNLVDKGIYGNQDQIPIAEVPTSGRTGFFESVPPLLDVAHLNLKHYRADSDNSYALHMSAVPILVRIGGNTGDETPSELVVGPNAGLDLPTNADLKFVTPPSSALDAAARAISQIVSDIGSLSLAMLAPQKRTAETAEAKRLDKAGSDSALAVTARGLQDALEQALHFHAKYLKLEDGGSVSINRDFQNSLMEPAVMTAIANLIKTGLPVGVALQMLQQGGRIPEDANLEILEMEWGANEAARSELIKIEADAKADTLDDAA